MRRCLILRQGTSPPRPPAPFPSGSMFQNGKNLSRVRKPAQKPRALDRFLPFRRATGMRERGPLGGGSSPPRHATKDYGPLKPKTSCRGDLRRGTTTSGPGRGPMGGFEVTLYVRSCSANRGSSSALQWTITGPHTRASGQPTSYSRRPKTYGGFIRCWYITQ